MPAGYSLRAVWNGAAACASHTLSVAIPDGTYCHPRQPGSGHLPTPHLTSPPPDHLLHFPPLPISTRSWPLQARPQKKKLNKYKPKEKKRDKGKRSEKFNLPAGEKRHPLREEEIAPRREKNSILSFLCRVVACSCLPPLGRKAEPLGTSCCYLSQPWACGTSDQIGASGFILTAVTPPNYVGTTR